jgi:cytochrome c-type biogenesis protein CcmH/NrfF
VPISRVASEVVWIFIGLAPVFLVFLMALIVHQIMKRREKKEKEARAQASAQA